MSEEINVEMISLARESRGLTQSALARKLSVSQGKISKIENGMLNVSDEMRDRIAGALDYPASFFYLPDKVYGTGISFLFHRKRKNIPQKILSKIHSQVNIYRIHVSKLMKAIELDQKFPQFDPDEFDGAAEKIAQMVRAAWLLPHGPMKNLIETIEAAGGIVITCDFGTSKVDAISQWIPGLPPLFYINSKSPGDRLRFSLAHELGHVIMHTLPRPNMEDEANVFAAEFLMPERDIKSELTQISLPKLASLKVRWRVSMAALLRRALHLKKISENKYRQICMQMGKAGYRTNEPVDVPVEKPSLLKEIIDRYMTELNYSLSDLGNLLAVHPMEFKSLYLSLEGGNVFTARNMA